MSKCSLPNKPIKVVQEDKLTKAVNKAAGKGK